MRKMTSAVIGAALMLSVVSAGAEEIQGKVQAVDPAERTIVLEDGTKVWVAEGVPMEDVKEGASVKAAFEERDGKKVATKVEVTP